MSNRSKSRRRGTISPKYNGVGSARRLIENCWVVRVSQGRDLANGKWLRVAKVVHGQKREAEQLLTELLGKQDYQIPIPRGRMTLGEWLEESLDTWGDNLAPQTRLRARESFARNLPPSVRATRLSGLSPDTFQRLYQDLQRGGKSASTVAYLHRALSSRLNVAVKLGRLARSPLTGVKAPRPEHKERRTLSREQAKTFLAALERYRVGAVFGLMVLVGLRPEEALGLKWEDYDGSVLQVRRALVWLKASPCAFETTKGKRARVVRLPTRGQNILKRHKAKQAVERLLLGAGYEDHGLVFATELGGPLRWSNVSRVFRALIQRLGLVGLRPYDLRHTAATLMLLSGSHPKEVSETLGHSSIQITLDVYTHVTPDMQERAAARMDAYLDSATVETGTGG